MDSIKCLEYSTMKVPYEVLNKTYRNAQKEIDREVNHMNNLIAKQQQRINLTEVSETEDQKGQLLQAIDEIETRLQHFETTLDNCVKAELDSLQRCRVRAEHLEKFASLYDAQAKAGKKPRADAKEKKEELERFERMRVNRMIVDHLLRLGHFDAAVALSEETGITELVDIDLFQETREIEGELRLHNPDPCLAWCQSNKSKLKKINSELESNLRLQQFIELVRVGKPCEAINHATKYLTQVEDSFMCEVQNAMGLLAFPTDTRFSRYQELLSDARWEDLISKFKSENYAILHMSPQSLLVTALQAGLASMKTHQCYNAETKNNNCPVCISPFNEFAESLPFAKYTHSRLLCSLTNSPMNEDNPPMALPNGRAYGEKGILERLDANGKFTCPVTKETYHLSECKKIFIM